MKKIICTVMALVMLLALAVPGMASEKETYKIGICNYLDDASLNQIVENIQAQLKAIGEEKDVTFDISYDNCNMDNTVMEQIIQNFIYDDVDLMVGVATPVAMAMQADTEDNQIPVIFSAVSDPEGAGLVESNEAPGANVTGTSDYLDTAAIFDLVFAADPEADLIGLLYDPGQESSATFIAAAKALLDEKEVEYREYTGTTTAEIQMAVQSLVADKVDAVFTPSDNSIMNAEPTIYEDLAEAHIPHYTGADSFALVGAFLGYGVDYANLGVETANMIAQVLLEDADPAELPVMTFDNGTATINTDVCEQITGKTFEELEELFAPMCTAVKPIQTADSFDDVAEDAEEADEATE